MGKVGRAKKDGESKKETIAERRYKTLCGLKQGCRVSTPQGEGEFRYMHEGKAVVTFPNPHKVLVKKNPQDPEEVGVELVTHSLYFDVAELMPIG